jgi:hypothetical protein
MSLSQRILKNHEDFIEGKINYLPFGNLGKLTEFFPGIMRGDITGVTGTPASSKTALVKHLILHQGIPWAIKNNKPLHVIYIGLEESPLQFDYSMLSYQCFIKHGLQYNIKDFESIGRTINKEDISKIDEVEKRVDKMKQYITYETNVYNSYGIWKTVREFASKRGKFYLKGQPINSFAEDSWDEYKPDNPDEFVVVVLDHLLLVSVQKNEKDQSEAMWNTVENLRRYAAIKLNYSVVVIQHQNADSENQESRKDKTILPTENGLARNKEIGRSYLNLIGVSNPNKVNSAGTQPTLRIWDNHDLTKLGNYLRTLNVLKSRYGETNVHDSVFFAGRTGYFSSFPVGEEYNKFLNNLKNYK